LHRSSGKVDRERAQGEVTRLVRPIAGVLAFRWIERLIRRRGELDIY